MSGAIEALPLMEALQLAAGLAVAGAVAGILAGLFGIGGGAVLVPVFYSVLGYLGIDEAVRMHLSLGTSMGVILPTSIRSYLAHRARGATDEALLRSWALAVPAGVVIASAAAAILSGEGLRAVFAVIALAVALRMLLNRPHWRLGDDLPANPLRSLIGAVLGFLSTLMGIGGGVLNNTFMTLYGRPIHQAVATSAGVGTLIAVPGTVGYIVAGWGAEGLPLGSLGFVNLIGVAVVIPVTLAVAPYGVRLAHGASKRALEIGFGIFLLTVSARFAWSLL